MTQLTGAEMFADLFEGYGVTHVFFVPTILNHALYQMEKRTSISRVLTHSEKAAAYMADGYARASGRPGICMAQTVGAANLAAGLRDGYMGCSPLIAIAGGPYKHTRNRFQYQEVEDFPLFKPVTKWSTRLDDVNLIPHVVRQAFRSATTGRPGPVAIEMDGHQGEVLERQSADVDLAIEERFAAIPPFRPEPERADVAAAAALLLAAERPVIVVGGGARTSGASAAIIELAERLSIPVASSLNGKAVVPASHPLSVGVVGLYSRETANRVVGEADLVFFIGSRTGSQVTHGWRLPPTGTKVIQCDLEGDVMGLNYPNAASLVGDARRSIELLNEELAAAAPPDHHAWLARVGEIVGSWRDTWTPHLTSDAVPIRPERLCNELSDHLPSDAILVADTGHAGMWTGGMIDLRQPGQDYLRAAGSLGWAVPAALGAKCAQPDRPVVAFTGDGGFWYHFAELETAIRWNINAVLVVNNNHALNQEIPLWKDAYGGELHGRHNEMWMFNETNFSKVAESIGAAAFRVEKASAFASTLEAALEADRPAVVEVMTDIEVTAPRGWFPS